MNLNHILCRGWREQYWVCSSSCSSLSESKTVGNNLPTDDTALPFSIGTMVGDSNYKSALKFNALFFYGRALDAEERTLMFAYSKKEYESIDPVELPSGYAPWSITIFPAVSLIK
jgi:hypothetical protein